MKINKGGRTTNIVSKHGTKVGEVYAMPLSEDVYFRCQGGMVNLASGECYNFPDITDNVQWEHLPKAVLVVNG